MGVHALHKVLSRVLHVRALSSRTREVIFVATAFNAFDGLRSPSVRTNRRARHCCALSRPREACVPKSAKNKNKPMWQFRVAGYKDFKGFRAIGRLGSIGSLGLRTDGLSRGFPLTEVHNTDEAGDVLTSTGPEQSWPATCPAHTLS